MESLGLITSHGFHKASFCEWFGEQRSTGIDLLRSKRPELHAWAGSSSWLDMSAKFIKEIYGNIYTAKINGYIPWAGIQRPAHWEGDEWNPGTAFKIKEDGTYEIQRGYYYYKQVSRAGQPGTRVVKTFTVDPYVHTLAFAGTGTEHPDAFVVLNLNKENRLINYTIRGTKRTELQGFRTSDDETDLYSPIGQYFLEKNRLLYDAPADSVTTFYFNEDPSDGQGRI